MNGTKKMSKSSNVLITGGMGFIGSNIAKILIKKKIASKCILLDSFSVYVDPLRGNYNELRKDRFVNLIEMKEYKASKTKNIVIERGDANDFKLIYKILNKYKPKIIFHTAGIPIARVTNPNANEFKRGSVDTTTNILECVNFFQNNTKFKLNRFLYISSSMVYGDFKKNKVSEKDKLNPKELYGTMKLAGEIVTQGLGTSYNIPYSIIRPSAVYGPTDMNFRVTQYFIEKALLGEKLVIHGKEEKLDFTFVEDLAEGCILAARSKKGINNVFNITYGKAQTIHKYVKILSKYIKNIKFVFKKRDKSRPKRGTLSIAKARSLLNYKPKYSLEKGTKIYLDFVKTKKYLDFDKLYKKKN